MTETSPMDPHSSPRAATLRQGVCTLRYGSCTLRFQAADAESWFSVPRTHAAFLVADDVAPDCTVRCVHGAPEAMVPDAPADQSGMWEVRRDALGAEQVCFYATIADQRRMLWQTLTFDAELRQVRLVQRAFSPTDTAIRIGYPIDEYIGNRVLHRRGALVLHASSVIVDGIAIVFAGHSGAGKSTISSLAEDAGAEVLSDDRTILSVGAHGVRAWGSPWHGSFERGSASSALVAGIFLLAQDQSDFVRPLRIAHAYGELFVRVIQPTVAPSDVLSGADTLRDIVARVPAMELHSRPTTAAFLLAREYVATLRAELRRGRSQPSTAPVAHEEGPHDAPAC